MKYPAALLILSLSAFAPPVQAEVKLPALFSDHAVLLSGAAVPVWGWADAGEKVEVSFAGQTKSATADASGKWRVNLDVLKADAKPQELTVKGKNTLTVKDVLVGEVWLGSGQSNMAMMVLGANDFGKEKAAANLPQLRMFTVASEPSAKAEQDCIGSWVLCSPKTVGDFSATPYFFGREIHKTLGVPTGWDSEFPFAWVQLPNLESPHNRWTLMREQTLKTLSVPKTGMAVSIDINTDIRSKYNGHPKNKQETGRRLSLWALGDVYGKKMASTSGPLPAGHEVKGDKIVLKFTNADGGLVAKGGELRSFQIAGEDKQWKPATAQILGDTVIVHSPQISEPVAARYAWKGWPDCNLYNGAGLPASPFRTDEWN